MKLLAFEVEGRRYELPIVRHNKQDWFQSYYIEKALGLKHLRGLIHNLTYSSELMHEKHWIKLSLPRPSDGKCYPQLLLSLRGVIRVAMRSQSNQARDFREYFDELLEDSDFPSGNIFPLVSHEEARSVNLDGLEGFKWDEQTAERWKIISAAAGTPPGRKRSEHLMEIALQFNITTATIYSMLKKYSELGIMSLMEKRGRPRKKSLTYE